MSKRMDLTKGAITKNLILLSLPIMGTSLIQMAYNLTDMFWLGQSGPDATAAVGTAGFYPWLGMALVAFSRVGGQIMVSQEIGKKDYKKTKSYIKSSLELIVVLAIFYTAVLLIFNKQLVDIYDLKDATVIKMTREYLYIVSLGIIFTFLNPVLTSIFNGLGNSKSPFIINTVGLITNIVLDPLLIFGIGPIKGYGVRGAAYATVGAQIIVTVLFIYLIIRNNDHLFDIKFFKNIEFNYIKRVIKLGLPVAIQSALFTLIAMVIGVFVADFGYRTVAAQKVGAQIESISWMICDGIAAAITTFIGQNYGVRKYDRVDKGAKIGICISIVWGMITTIILFAFNTIIFNGFIADNITAAIGARYLRILSYSQLFMCIEIVTTGIFNGLARTKIPPIISITFTGLRIPMAYVLSRPEFLGVEGLWWAISISSIIKGILFLILFGVLYKRKTLYKRIEDKKEISYA